MTRRLLDSTRRNRSWHVLFRIHRDFTTNQFSMDPLTSRSVRSVFWRLGRKLYQYARREGPNDPRRNGEYWLIDAAIAHAGPGGMTLLDVGANRGDWTAEARDGLARHHRQGTTHAFEPTPSTFQFLTQRFAGDTSIRTIPLAVSEEPGQLTLYVVAELAGTNSVVTGQGGRPIRVEVTTIDHFLMQQQIAHVAFLKSDTEGHDLAVLRGGARSLAAGQIEAWQFEYNHRWIHSRSFLKDVFELISDKPYILGKLYRDGIEVFDAWHPELERYFESNFVLIRKGTFLETLARQSRFDQSNVPVRVSPSR